MGYPLVSVKRNYAEKSFSVDQQWFLLNPSKEAKSNLKTQKWYVPFTFTTKDELIFDFETKPIWLKPQDTNCNIIFVVVLFKKKCF